MSKHIQIFLHGDGSPEVSGEVVKWTEGKFMLDVTCKDDTGYVFRNQIPYTSIRFIRHIDDKRDSSRRSE